MPILRTLLYCCFLVVITHGSGQSQRGPVTVPLSVYNIGLGGGAFFPFSNALNKESDQYLKMSLIQSISLKERIGLFLDVNYFFPGKNFGADLGFDFFLNTGDIKLFIGTGLGGHYFEKSSRNFGENFGTSSTLHVGFLLDLSERVQIRVRAPYNIVFNSDKDNGMGVDIGIQLSDKFRKIKKLQY